MGGDRSKAIVQLQRASGGLKDDCEGKQQCKGIYMGRLCIFLVISNAETTRMTRCSGNFGDIFKNLAFPGRRTTRAGKDGHNEPGRKPLYERLTE